jgi:hypothetical protein
MDILYDEALGITDGDISTGSWTLEEVYTTEDSVEGEEKVFVYVKDDDTISTYESDCEEIEHDGFALEMADAAFDDILEEVIADAKETIV